MGGVEINDGMMIIGLKEIEVTGGKEPILIYAPEGDTYRIAIPLMDVSNALRESLRERLALDPSAEEDPEHATFLLSKLSALLEGVAKGLKGPPEAMTLHSWHDLPEKAKEAREAAEQWGRVATDAQRWRSLMACKRIRVIGGSDLGTPHALLGLDFHKSYPDGDDDSTSRRILLDFVDGVEENPKRAALSQRLGEVRSQIEEYDIGDRPMSPPAWLLQEERDLLDALSRIPR